MSCSSVVLLQGRSPSKSTPNGGGGNGRTVRRGGGGSAARMGGTVRRVAGRCGTRVVVRWIFFVLFAGGAVCSGGAGSRENIEEKNDCALAGVPLMVSATASAAPRIARKRLGAIGLL